ncbi:MAG: hypothetical protein NZM25_07025 [Leptospiraceae bacterium]|nr:hypothetical protein [Leptospiraceae bacterium]MDW8307072.1 hypothetical protein [Leptospiraceae bacterium]
MANQKGKILLYLTPFFVYFFFIVVLAFLLLPEITGKFYFLYPLYALTLIGGYIVYFIALRWATDSISHGQIYFRIMFHFPYFFYLVFAAVVGFGVIRVFLHETWLLGSLLLVGLVVMLFFFYLGIDMVTKTLSPRFPKMRFTHFLPLILFLLAAIPLSLVLIPLGKDSVLFLGIAFGISLFFSVLIYYVGQFLTYLSFRGEKLRMRWLYHLPILVYVIVAAISAYFLLPSLVGERNWLYLGYGLSLFGITFFYFLMVFLMLRDFSQEVT